MRLLLFAAAAVLSVTLAVHADTVKLTLTNPNGSVPSSGGSLTYGATVNAPASNTAAVFLNGDMFTVTSPVTLNESGFFTNFPLSLAPGTSFTGNLFVLTVPSGAPLNTYQGTFALLGGANSSAYGTLSSVNFSLSTAGVAVTPEPSSVILFATGLLGVAGVVRKRLV